MSKIVDKLSLASPYFVLTDLNVEIYSNGDCIVIDGATDCVISDYLKVLLVVLNNEIRIIDFHLKTLYNIEINYVAKITTQESFIHIYQSPPATCSNDGNTITTYKDTSMYYLIHLSNTTYNIAFSRQFKRVPMCWPYTSIKNNIILVSEHNNLNYYVYEPTNIHKEIKNTYEYNKNPIDVDQIEQITYYEFSPYSNDLIFAVFMPERNRFPAFIELYKKTIGKPCELLNTISVMNKTSVKFQWCPSGHILLATTTTNFDETGHNYYGSSSLQSLYVPLTTNNTSAYPKEVFLSPTNNIFTQTLCQSEVQSATFDPTGKLLAILFGSQPCNLTIYDTTNMNVVFAREKVFMNTLMFSPNSQFLAVAGFENLPGDVEIYEVKTFKIVCKFIAQCTSLWMWDIKNTTILCGQSYPRRKFDNKIAVFGIDGLLIEKRDFVGKFMYSFGIFGEKQMQDVVFKYIKYNENIELYSPQKR